MEKGSNSMKILYGSQNFGYEKPDSDHDYMMIVYPNWNDIMINNTVSKTLVTSDKSLIKVKDIRLIPSMFTKSCFSDLQILYSKQYINCEDLAWFIDNRDLIIRANLYNAYKSNSGIIRKSLLKTDKLDAKELTRSFTYHDLLIKLLDSSTRFELYDRSKYKYRLWAEGLPADRLQQEALNILKSLSILEKEFERFSNHSNLKINEQVRLEVSRLLKHTVDKYSYRDLS